MICPDCQIGILTEVIATDDESSQTEYYCPYCDDVIPGIWDKERIEQNRRLLADEL